MLTPRDPHLGTVVAGRFRVQALLGEGQMARVYVAEQVSMKREVALKILRRDLTCHPSAPVRFRREVEAVTRLRSPHSIVFYDFGDTGDGSLYIAMELLSGETLRERLDREGALEPFAALDILRQVASCLKEAHEAGVLHRDLKPENIFLCPTGAGRRPFVKVLDFGLAKLTERVLGEAVNPVITSPSLTVGTPAYIAPEMATLGRSADPRADLYGLGVMTFEMLVGGRPFQAKSPFLMLQEQIHSPVPLPSQHHQGLPPGCDGFMVIALAKDPEERFQSAEAFIAALASALGERRLSS